MSTQQQGIKTDLLNKFKSDFTSNPKNRLAQLACTKGNLIDVLRTQKADQGTAHVFTQKVETEGKPMTNQKSSGRCWIFACMNCMRVPVMKKLEIDEFELSQNYLFFWDKVERMNYLLHAFVDTARRKEAVDGRLLQHLLKNPSEDGGQWSMLVNVIEKHGVMPKACFLEAWSAENTRRLNLTINTKMREFCMQLRGLVKKGVSSEDIQVQVDSMMEQIYNVCSITLGSPPEKFTWEYYNKNKEYKKIGPISPVDFYKEFVKPVFNMEDKLILVNDPRPQNDFNKLYTVEYLGNMTEGGQVLYINQSIDVLKRAAADSIRDNEPVWFGCDVGKHCSWTKVGLNDLDVYDYDLVFGMNLLGTDKADRLLYGESLMTHAMTLTAFSEEEGQLTKWRVENSWGADGGEKGYLVMTDKWFSEFVYEVAVDKKYLPQEVQDVLKQDVIVLPAWDPMGALAHSAKL